MKKMSQVVLGSILTFCGAGVLADDHEMFAGDMDPAEPMSIQANICTLNDGVSLMTTTRSLQKYQKWASKKRCRSSLCFGSFPFDDAQQCQQPVSGRFCRVSDNRLRECWNLVG